SILSGLYPALFISSYNPVAIFRDKKIRIGKNLFTKILLGFQFVVSFILITVTIVVRLNAEYQSGLDWKYNADNIVVVSVNGEEHYTKFKNEIGKNPDIVSISGGSNHIGSVSSSERIEYRGEKYEVRRFDIGLNYLETMGVKLKDGRFFDEERGTDISSAVLVNEEFVRFMKWDNPLNEYFMIGSNEYSVIGVVNDFHHNNFMEKIRPMVFRLTDENNFKYLVVKTREGKMIDSFEYLRNTWKELLPEEPYDAFYQSHLFDHYLRNEKNV
ncbi:MAG: hypothetical protein GY863_23295, partial [bacterium]|nr:hypothetical protein [bacterium]